MLQVPTSIIFSELVMIRSSSESLDCLLKCVGSLINCLQPICLINSFKALLFGSFGKAKSMFT